jgi:hypothetical protein
VARVWEAVNSERQPDLRSPVCLPTMGQVLPGDACGVLPQRDDDRYGNEQAAVETIKTGAVDYVVKSDATLASMPHC